jgi:hypothetical protein
MRIDARMFAFVPGGVRMAVGNLPPVRRFIGMLLRDFRIPKETLKFITYPTRFDNREPSGALRGSGIQVPKLDTYAWRLWDYWERHLDPDLFVDRSLKGKVRNKVVLITGGSSGIGLSSAQRVAEAGAITDHRRARRDRTVQGPRRHEGPRRQGLRLYRPTSRTWPSAIAWSRRCWPSMATSTC